MFGKGKKALTAFDEHFRMVEQCYTHFVEFIREYCQNGCCSPKANALYETIDQEEKRADELRREIVSQMLTGALLPGTRKELLELSGGVDHVANKAQNVSRLLIYEQVEFPEDMKADMIRIAEITLEQLGALEEVVALLFSDYEKLIKDNSLMEKVKDCESEVDALELGRIKKIFATDMSLAEKNHLRYFASRIADPSDLIEDLADSVQIMLVYRKV